MYGLGILIVMSKAVMCMLVLYKQQKPSSKISIECSAWTVKRNGCRLMAPVPDDCISPAHLVAKPL